MVSTALRILQMYVIYDKAGASQRSWLYEWYENIFQNLLVDSLSHYDLQFSILSTINYRIKSCFIFDN